MAESHWRRVRDVNKTSPFILSILCVYNYTYIFILHIYSISVIIIIYDSRQLGAHPAFSSIQPETCFPIDPPPSDAICSLSRLRHMTLPMPFKLILCLFMSICSIYMSILYVYLCLFMSMLWAKRPAFPSFLGFLRPRPRAFHRRGVRGRALGVRSTRCSSAPLAISSPQSRHAVVQKEGLRGALHLLTTHIHIFIL